MDHSGPVKFGFPQGVEEVRRVSELPTMAVDLGFAKKRKSCGLAWQISDDEPSTSRATFGQCIDKVADFLKEKSTSVLIVEAPLSSLFDSAGNPKPRMPFEEAQIDGTVHRRYWYVGAGGAIGLGAIFFFSRLSELTMQASDTVHVIEGFVSFKTQRSDDVEDALALLKEFRNPTEAKLCQIEPNDPEGRAINMLGVSHVVSPEEPCPMVIVTTVEGLDQES